jgi:hypothetical protein
VLIVEHGFHFDAFHRSRNLSFLGSNLLHPPFFKIFILFLRAHHHVSAYLVGKTFIYLLMCSLLNMVSILMLFTGVEISCETLYLRYLFSKIFILSPQTHHKVSAYLIKKTLFFLLRIYMLIIDHDFHFDVFHRTKLSIM